jgi:hypothetical protein
MWPPRSPGPKMMRTALVKSKSKKNDIPTATALPTRARVLSHLRQPWLRPDRARLRTDNCYHGENDFQSAHQALPLRQSRQRVHPRQVRRGDDAHAHHSSHQRSSGMLTFRYTFPGKLWISLGWDVNAFEKGMVEWFCDNTRDLLYNMGRRTAVDTDCCIRRGLDVPVLVHKFGV